MDHKRLEKYNCNLIPLSSHSTKPIFYRQDDPSILVKEFSDLASMKKEHDIHVKAQSLVPSPTIIDCFTEHSKGYILMTRISGDTIYNIYGQEPTDVPKSIWNQIHSIIYKLYYNNIHYIDITPFNFIVDSKGSVHIIDFGDAYTNKVNWFLKDFLDGENVWNPDFE